MQNMAEREVKPYMQQNPRQIPVPVPDGAGELWIYPTQEEAREASRRRIQPLLSGGSFCNINAAAGHPTGQQGNPMTRRSSPQGR